MAAKIHETDGSSRADQMPAEAAQAMPTARKLWIGFGALTSLLVLFGNLMFIRMQSIERNVHKQTDVARPRIVAIRELEINVLDYTLNVHARLAGSAVTRTETKAAAANVGRYIAEYETFAESSRRPRTGGTIRSALAEPSRRWARRLWTRVE